MTSAHHIHEFLDSVENAEGRLLAKRLAANDTLATGSHQAGLYVPNDLAFDLFPTLKSVGQVNPRKEFDAEIVSHGENRRVVNIIWYNQKTRNECHITRWGGNRSPILDPEATGSLCLFAFYGEEKHDVDYCQIWLCQGIEEEDEFEGRFDVVEPGTPLFLDFRASVEGVREPSRTYSVVEEQLQLWSEIDEAAEFPSGKELIGRIVRGLPELASLPVDKRLLRRRESEYVEFQRIERKIVLPRVKEGFDDVDKFVDYANSVTNRRKSRAGKSLELHMVKIFQEEGISTFAHDEVTESNKRPDFIFPSIAAYKDPEYSSDNLHMLACKTTCKDRWRQIIDEAPRIRLKHLLTLQQGVSVNQYTQMQDAGVRLVVPKELHSFYPRPVRHDLESVEGFVSLLKSESG